MHYVNFGSAGVKVSRIALGMGLREQYTDEGAERLVGHAIDSGVNFIDCANRYGLGDDRVNLRGTAEQALGRALRTRRDEVVITTKVTGAMGDGPNDSGAARVHIMREVERSLTRLQTDRIDVYLLHGWDDSTPIEETVRALDDLVTQGKVLYFGCCNYAAWQVCKALWTADRLGAHRFICVQNEYSLLRRGLEKEMFGLIRDQGLGAMAYSPLKAGLLSGVYTPGQPPPPGSLWDQRPDEDYSSALPPSSRAADRRPEVDSLRARRQRASGRDGLGALASRDHRGHLGQRHDRAARRQPRRPRAAAHPGRAPHPGRRVLSRNDLTIHYPPLPRRERTEVRVMHPPSGQSAHSRDRSG